MDNLASISFGFWLYGMLMLVGGLLGGTISYFYHEDYREIRLGKARPGRWQRLFPLLMRKRLLLGIGAAFLVPVFLDSIESNILKPDAPEPKDLLVFFGICVAAAIFSSRFIGSVSERLLKQAEAKAEEAISETRQVRLNQRALSLSKQQLDPETSAGVDQEELQEAIRLADGQTRSLVFMQARDFRERFFWRDPAKLSQAVPIFETLIALDEAHKYHRNQANLGYCLLYKADPDAQQAFDRLTEAITMRDQTTKLQFQAYEFNRAFARVALGEPDRALVLEDLRKGIGYADWEKAIVQLLKAEEPAKVRHKVNLPMWHWLREQGITSLAQIRAE